MAEKQLLIPASTGRKIAAWLMHPDGADLNSTSNIIILGLHGVGENSKVKDSMDGLAYFRSHGPQELFKAVQQPIKGRNFILVAPNLFQGDQGDPNGNRNGCWPSWYVTETINWIKANLKYDTTRFCGTGLSLGGGGMLNFITESEANAKMFSAVVCCCPVGIGDGYENIVKAKLPVAFYHCQDDWVGYKNSWNVMQEVNNNPAVSVRAKGKYPPWGGHGVWPVVYNHLGDPFGNGVNMYDFFGINQFGKPFEMPDIDKPYVPPTTQGVTTQPATTTQPVTTTQRPVTTQPATTKPATTQGITTKPAPTSQPATTTRPGTTTVAPGLSLIMGPDLSFPAGTKTFLLENKSTGWKNIWWQKISGPAFMWFAPPGRENDPMDYSSSLWQVYGVTDGDYIFEVAIEDQHGAQKRGRTRVTVGGNTQPATTTQKVGAYYLVQKVYTDGSVDRNPMRVELDKVNL